MPVPVFVPVPVPVPVPMPMLVSMLISMLVPVPAPAPVPASVWLHLRGACGRCTHQQQGMTRLLLDYMAVEAKRMRELAAERQTSAAAKAGGTK